MYAFVNNAQSCYMDAVLVCMLAPTDCFEFMLGGTETADALETQAHMLTSELPTQGWALKQLRQVMGPPWNTNSAQSAVDFFHALLDMCGVEELGTQSVTTCHVPRDTRKPEERDILHNDTFRVHTVIAGYHASLLDSMFNTEHMQDPTSKYTSIITNIQVHSPDVLVFEVARNDSTSPVHYGSLRGGEECVLKINAQTYVLFGVVCRVQAHYVAYVWMQDWFFYDDMDKGKVVECAHPEASRIKPSRYGEMFFYYLK